MSGQPALACWNCGASLAEVALPISRHAFCAACGEAVHCCRQCGNFDSRAAGQCTEARAEPPNDRTAANFCEWFGPAGGFSGGLAGDARRAADAARARLEALFGPAPDET